MMNAKVVGLVERATSMDLKQPDMAINNQIREEVNLNGEK
jgi:hypothetical protein